MKSLVKNELVKMVESWKSEDPKFKSGYSIATSMFKRGHYSCTIYFHSVFHNEDLVVIMAFVIKYNIHIWLGTNCIHLQ